MTQEEIQQWLHQEIVASGTDDPNFTDYKSLFSNESPTIVEVLEEVFNSNVLKNDDIDYGDGEIYTNSYFYIKDKIVRIEIGVVGQYRYLSSIEIVEPLEVISICDGRMNYYQSCLNKLIEITT